MRWGPSLGQRRKRPLVVGSVKTNIGHLEAAAGIAGLIKTVLALQHRQIPPHLHFHTPNPHIDWDVLRSRCPQPCSRGQHWPRAEAGMAGVSAFGISGTNAHVLLAAAPQGAGQAQGGQIEESDGRRGRASPDPFGQECGGLAGTGSSAIAICWS